MVQPRLEADSTVHDTVRLTRTETDHGLQLQGVGRTWCAGCMLFLPARLYLHSCSRTEEQEELKDPALQQGMEREQSPASPTRTRETADGAMLQPLPFSSPGLSIGSSTGPTPLPPRPIYRLLYCLPGQDLTYRLFLKYFSRCMNRPALCLTQLLMQALLPSSSLFLPR